MSMLCNKQAITYLLCLSNDTLSLTTPHIPSVSATVKSSLYDHIQSYCISIVFQLSLVLSCIATPAGVIAGVVVGVFLALVLIIVVAVIVATVVLVHRRKTVPGMCLKFEYVHVANAVVGGPVYP